LRYPPLRKFLLLKPEKLSIAQVAEVSCAKQPAAQDAAGFVGATAPPQHARRDVDADFADADV